MEEYTRLAAEVAIAARDEVNPSAFVAGGMAPPRHEAGPDGLEELSREFTDQARVLADAGVDVLLPEYLGTIAECVTAVDACASTGVPVLLGVRHITDEGDMQYGETFEQLVKALGKPTGGGDPGDVLLARNDHGRRAKAARRVSRGRSVLMPTSAMTPYRKNSASKDRSGTCSTPPIIRPNVLPSLVASGWKAAPR